MNVQLPIFGVSDFVAVFNQTLETTYPAVDIVGELANFSVRKNHWVYFDLKDDYSTVNFFGSVYALPGPLQDGMLLKVRSTPRLHPQFGFKLSFTSITPVGEGSINKAAKLLEAKLSKEGLFDGTRKRQVPYPPTSIGLITSGESAAYHDFIKILNHRWQGINIYMFDVLVQGDLAPSQITNAISAINSMAQPLEALVIIRGGGSPEDLAAFSTEQVIRAVAGSRIPTLVAIGHETDVSLAEMAADLRASTPSNAAELLVPDKKHEKARMGSLNANLNQYLTSLVASAMQSAVSKLDQLNTLAARQIENKSASLIAKKDLLSALNPGQILKRGYAIVRAGGKVIKSGKQVKVGSIIDLEMTDALLKAKVNKVTTR